MWIRVAILSLAAILVALPLATPVLAKSVHKEFVEGWEERSTRHKSNYESATIKMREASGAFFNTVVENDPEFEAKLNAMLNSTEELGYHAARSEQLSALIAFMDAKPSAGRAELWLQEQIEILGQAERDVKSQFDRYSVMKIGENGVTAKQLLSEMGGVYFREGVLRGRFDELKLISENLGTYYRLKDEQDLANRTKWAAVLGSLGQSLQAQSQARSGFMMSCTTTGIFTNCTGN